MNFPEFKSFTKIPRLSREIIITEKIDGSNGVILIDKDYNIFAGSRNRWLWGSIQDKIHNDNHGFAAWVREHQRELLGLGRGYHWGEWMGQKIQRTYGLKEKRFYLFNVNKWTSRKNIPNKYLDTFIYCPDCCYVVPILYKGIFDTHVIRLCLENLKLHGGKAVPNFMKPEGICIYHTAGNIYFK
ncbi:MAG TPA: RNA ligase family protein, partial [Candidatus Lokiarchaeia archaeon]